MRVQDPKAMLEAYVEATFLWFRLYPKHAAILFLSCHLAAHHPKTRQLLTTMRDSSESRIAEILSKHPGLKAKPKAWVARKASEVRNVLIGALLNYFTTDSTTSYEALEHQTISSVEAIVRGA